MLSRCFFFYNFSSSFFIIFPIFFVVCRRLLVLRLRCLPLSFLIFVPPLPPRGWNSESRNWIRNESGEGVEGASCCRRRPSGGVLLGGVRERKLARGRLTEERLLSPFIYAFSFLPAWVWPALGRPGSPLLEQRRREGGRGQGAKGARTGPPNWGRSFEASRAGGKNPPKRIEIGAGWGDRRGLAAGVVANGECIIAI